MTSPHSRRRERSTRLVSAAALLVAAVVVVLVAVAVHQVWLLAGAAVLAVALGSAATRLVHLELAQSRRDAARDRATVARSYVEITEQANAESSEFMDTMKKLLHQRVAERDQVIAELQDELVQAQLHAAEADRATHAERRRANVAEAEQRVLVRSLEAAELKAADAVVRVAELEGEIDALRAELKAWQAENQEYRKHA